MSLAKRSWEIKVLSVKKTKTKTRFAVIYE
jgi:hypothetical protein